MRICSYVWQSHAQDELIDVALTLFHSGYYSTLIIAGKTRGHKSSEAREIADRVISVGLSHQKIILEEESFNTGENIRNTREMMSHHGLRELLLIGKIYAKRQYVMTIKKQWPEIERVSCAAINYFGVERDQWWKSQALRSRILAEMRKTKEYLQKGHLSEVEIIDRIFRCQAPLCLNGETTMKGSLAPAMRALRSWSGNPRPDTHRGHPEMDLPTGEGPSGAPPPAGADGAAGRADSRDGGAGTPKPTRARPCATCRYAAVGSHESPLRSART